MSASIIPYTPCAACCDCPTPTLQWDSISASKTKCGYAENAAFVSTPPVIYRVMTWSGTSTDTRYDSTIACSGSYFFKETRVYSGAGTYIEDCSCSSTKQVTITIEGFPSNVFDFGCSTRQGTTANDISSTVRFISQDDCAVDPSGISNARHLFSDITETFSDPYTTANLLADTLAALPAFDDDWDDTAGSYYDLTSDELTNSIRESRYRFRFKIPKVGRGTCYKIKWTEVFMPEEGDPVETERCAIWDGTIPEGYDPDDPSTWPIIGDGTNPYFELAIPEENGTITVDPDSIVAVCRGCGTPCPE